MKADGTEYVISSLVVLAHLIKRVALHFYKFLISGFPYCGYFFVFTSVGIFIFLFWCYPSLW